MGPPVLFGVILFAVFGFSGQLGKDLLSGRVVQRCAVHGRCQRRDANAQCDEGGKGYFFHGFSPWFSQIWVGLFAVTGFSSEVLENRGGNVVVGVLGREIDLAVAQEHTAVIAFFGGRGFQQSQLADGVFAGSGANRIFKLRLGQGRCGDAERDDRGDCEFFSLVFSVSVFCCLFLRLCALR